MNWLARSCDRLHRLEDGLLAFLLGALLLVAVGQIVLRLGFDSGLSWAEPVARMGVLWLALLGALGATRQHRHIAIDALPRLLHGSARRAAHVLSQIAASAICGLLAWLGWGMLLMEREAPSLFAAGVPSWVPMLLFPAAFALMSLRFLISALLPPPEPGTP